MISHESILLNKIKLNISFTIEKLSLLTNQVAQKHSFMQTHPYVI